MPLPGAYSSGTLPKTPFYRGGGRVQLFKEAASQTFQYGEIVAADASGNVVNMGTLADPAAAAISASLAAGDYVLGMALAPANNASAVPAEANIPVALDDGVNEFFLRLYNVTATSAEVQDIAVGDLAEPFRYNGAGDIQTVLSAAANGTDGINKFVITEVPVDRQATDQYPGVWCQGRASLRYMGR